MNELLKFLIAAALGLLAGYAVAKVAEVVAERITAANLAYHARKALEKQAEEKIQRWLSEAIEVEVKRRQGKVLTLDALRSGEKFATIELTAESIADDVYEGQKIPI